MKATNLNTATTEAIRGFEFILENDRNSEKISTCDSAFEKHLKTEIVLDDTDKLIMDFEKGFEARRHKIETVDELLKNVGGLKQQSDNIDTLKYSYDLSAIIKLQKQCEEQRINYIYAIEAKKAVKGCGELELFN